MTDKEKREDAEIQDHLKKVYGFSEEQLLKEVEKAEKSVIDSDFPGVEERIFQKLMERKVKEESAAENKPALEVLEERLQEESEAGQNDPVEKEEKEKEPGKKDLEKKEPKKRVVRFKKKGIFLAAAVAAILALALGSTAIGEKNYFMRPVKDQLGYVIDNNKNKLEISKLENAYTEIEERLNIPVLKLAYVPEKMKFNNLDFEDNRAIISFQYDGKIIYYILKSKGNEASIDIESDEEGMYYIHNKWLNKDIGIKRNTLTDEEEYEVRIYVDREVYCLTGKFEKEELEKIVENLNFY